VELVDRNHIETIVRELEGSAFGLALSLVSEPIRAEQVVVDAFCKLTPSLRDSWPLPDLRVRLGSLIERLAAPKGWRYRLPLLRHGKSSTAGRQQAARELAVSQALHLRIVDQVEEQQGNEAVGRRRAVLLVVLAIVVLSALGAVQIIRSEALAAARPTITDRFPSVGAIDVAVDGDIQVVFGRRPAGKPTVRFEPADSVLTGLQWDATGGVLDATYTGLHRARKYQLIVDAPYQSRFKDSDDFEQRWSFVTEGYPVVAATAPLPGETEVARAGSLSVSFDRKPPVDPAVSIVPADAVMESGQWTGSTWTVGYSGLKPLTSYQATVVVDYGVRSANVRTQWSFSTEPAAPPPGTSVVWFGLSPPYKPVAGPQRNLAVDWNGTLVGSMYGVNATQQAPDGSTLVAMDGSLVDRNGTPMNGVSGSAYSVMIADDSRSVCQVSTDPAGNQSLLAGPIHGGLHRVAPVGSVGARSGLGLIACSALNDRAVVAEVGMGGTAAVQVISLSTGRLLFERSYTNVVGGIVSSGDGRYLGEPIATFDGQGNATGSTTNIRRVSDGQVVARLDGLQVALFSWDDRRVLTTASFGGTASKEVDLLDWETMTVLWRLPLAAGTQGPPTVYAMAQPNGGDVVIGVEAPSSGGEIDGLWVVGPDGLAKILAFGPLYPAFGRGF
jgi:hypothetical protein